MKIYFVADDFGSNKNVNNAILQVCSCKIVHYVTILGSEQSVYSDLPENISKGIHLYLTDCLPLNDKLNKLCKNSRGMTKRQFIFNILSGKITKSDIYSEFDTQFLKLINNGFDIKFIDSHQNIHSLPFVFGIVKRIARKYDLENSIRPFSQLEFNLNDNIRTFYSKLYSRVVDFKTNSRVLINTYPGYDNKTYDISTALSKWDNFFHSMVKLNFDEIYVPCHPGNSPAEVEFYTSDKFYELIKKHKIGVI